MALVWESENKQQIYNNLISAFLLYCSGLAGPENTCLKFGQKQLEMNGIEHFWNDFFNLFNSYYQIF